MQSKIEASFFVVLRWVPEGVTQITDVPFQLNRFGLEVYLLTSN